MPRASIIVTAVFVTGGLLIPSSSNITRAQQVGLERGSLIVAIPTADGLVVASDSRGSMSGDRFCDDVVKILPLKHIPRTVIAVAGTERIFIKEPTGTPACENNRRKPMFDFLQLATDFLDSGEAIVSLHWFNKLRDFMLKRVRQSQRDAPDLSEACSTDGVAIVLASYEPKSKTAIVATFEICAEKPAQRVEILRQQWTEFHQEDPAYANATGTRDFDLIQSGKAVQYVRSVDLTSYYIFSSKQISEVSSKDGLKMATILISATTELTNLPGHDKSVHGPIHAFLLNGQVAPIQSQ